MTTLKHRCEVTLVMPVLIKGGMMLLAPHFLKILIQVDIHLLLVFNSGFQILQTLRLIVLIVVVFHKEYNCRQ